MEDTTRRIADWETAGLISTETAARLRATLDQDAIEAPHLAPSTADTATSVRGVFGPRIQVAEAFAYLGIGFLASAWIAYLGSIAGIGNEARTTWLFGSGAAACAFAGMVAILRRGDDRRRRGAGVASLVSTGYAASAFWFAASLIRPDDDPLDLVVSALGATIVAFLFRLVLPALLTQFGALVSITTLAGAVMNFAQISIFGQPTFDGSPDKDALLKLILEAAWWIGAALLVAILGLREDSNAIDRLGRRRASLSRLWAGLVVVIGVALAVTRTGPLSDVGFDYGRILEPWIGDVIIGAIAIVLVERAFRRGAGAYLAGAAIGLVIALTDFNASYLSDSIQTGLLVEGVILLAIGFGANRLRSMLDRSRRTVALDPARTG